MTDRIILANMQFQGRHGWHQHEVENPQAFEVDIELERDLGPAASTDDLAKTIDYGTVYDAVRQIVEGRSFRLLEALAEAIAQAVLGAFDVAAVTVRLRKPQVQLGGPLDYAGVEIHRHRGG